MEYRYYINKSDEAKAKELLSSKNIEILREENGQKNETNRSFLLVPLAKEKTVVLVLDKEPSDPIFQTTNDLRRSFLEKIEKAKPFIQKGNALALLATFTLIVSIGLAFFSIGFGMKKGSGYYALFILAIAFLVLTVFLIRKGAALYEMGRERKNAALILIGKKKPFKKEESSEVENK